MEEQDIPYFRSATEALASGCGTFKLVKNGGGYDVDLNAIPQDKWHIFQNLMLEDPSLDFEIHDAGYIRFISNILREHNDLKEAFIEVNYEIEDSDMEELIAAIKASRIRELELRKGYALEFDMSPIIRAAQHINTLRKFGLFFTPTLEECEAMAVALQNPNLQAFAALYDDSPPEHWPLLAPILINNPILKELELQSCKPKNFEQIGEILGQLESLETLILVFNDSFTAAEVQNNLISKLTNKPALKKLDLQLINDEQIRQFYKALAYNQLNASTIRFNFYTNHCQSEDTVKTLSDSLKTNTCLTKLSVAWIRIDKHTALAEALKCNTTLKSLRVQCTEDIDGLKAICDLLQSNASSLTDLDLAYSTFSDKHFELLSDMMKYNTTLHKLGLESTYLDDQTLTNICNALIHNKTIRTIHIGGHRQYYDSEGVRSVSNMLKINNTLRRLKMNCNMDDAAEDLKLICDGLRHNTSLVYIDLSDPTDYIQEYSDILVEQLRPYNYALTSIKPYDKHVSKVSSFLTRNKRVKSEAQFKVAILSHNILRSQEALVMLPREIWMKILGSYTHPGTSGFDTLVNSIFNSYQTN